MPQTNIRKLKAHLSQVLREVREKRARYLITHRGRPIAALVPLDEPPEREAAGLAADLELRGSDATYAAVALGFGSELVTLDRQQQERLATAVVTRTPAEVDLGQD